MLVSVYSSGVSEFSKEDYGAGEKSLGNKGEPVSLLEGGSANPL